MSTEEEKSVIEITNHREDRNAITATYHDLSTSLGAY